MKTELKELLYPYLLAKRQKIEGDQLYFAYYTTSDTAEKILSSGSIWLRSHLVMNDHSEVLLGTSLMWEAYNSMFKTLCEVLEQCYQRNDISDMLKLRMDCMPYELADTYICCFSEHAEADFENGRLSMWRGYGCNGVGVAMVLKPELFMDEKIDVGAYFHPVQYVSVDPWGMNQERINPIKEFLNGLIGKIKSNENEIAQLVNADDFIDELCNALRYLAVTMKHKGFEEEREWRLISCRYKVPDDNRALKKITRSVGGVAQNVLVLDSDELESLPASGPTVASAEPRPLLQRLLHKLLIGPSEFDKATYLAMCSLWEEKIGTNPTEFVALTGIPLRNNQR